MTILYALLILLVAVLVTTITSLYELLYSYEQHSLGPVASGQVAMFRNYI